MATQQFKKVSVTNPITKKTGYTFRQVHKVKYSEYDIAENMQQSGSLTKGDSLNACVSLGEQIANCLAANGEITIQGFGTFTLSTEGTGSQENAADLKKTDIQRSIAFQPCDQMLTIVRSADIKIVKTSTTDDDTADTDSQQTSGSTGGTDLEG